MIVARPVLRAKPTRGQLNDEGMRSRNRSATIAALAMIVIGKPITTRFQVRRLSSPERSRSSLP